VGVWDRAHGEFTLDVNTSVERLYKAAPDVPFVMVSGQSPVPMRVFGFFGLPWEQTAFYNVHKTERPLTVAERPVAVPVPLPPHAMLHNLQKYPLPTA